MSDLDQMQADIDRLQADVRHLVAVVSGLMDLSQAHVNQTCRLSSTVADARLRLEMLKRGLP